MIRLETVRAIWAQQIDETSEFMGAVCLEDGELLLRYRLRYYKDKLVDRTSRDEKRWYEVRPKNKSESELINIMRAMLQTAGGMVGAAARYPRHELIRGELPLDEFMDALTAWPCIHVERVTDPAVIKDLSGRA